MALYPPGERVSEPLDDRLRDDAALAEIELTSRLMIAASGAAAPLSQAEIDGLLGIDPHA
ncbi:hypothetical protein [Aeromicrobium duanguangcaii]|uniref:hypothetical protein n=1 Tax=Aeromicrobium duanguangcaii TaxID=2968086 RepID=UPI002016AF2A|nr:hypothetical protein [Aeromicrobium duanguangcaii]MCL3837886.1 hypothetical protein [Aeromicrobium duanguangcaii]